MTTVVSFTPPNLRRNSEHIYDVDGRVHISVTQALREAALVDAAFFTEADRIRGARVHDAIARYHCDQQCDLDGIDGYMRAYLRFQSESAFRVDASEEMVCDSILRVAGTLDLRGEFVALDGPGRVDIIDIKTGSTPPWIGYQVAGYVRLLPVDVAKRARRWSLTLRADASYTLEPLTKRSDEAVFLSAVTVAHAKRGWL